MTRRCLVIADDLTGAVDTGAQFARRGLNTLLVLGLEGEIDFSGYPEREVLVVSTHSRGLSPEEAFRRVSLLFDSYRQDLFPIVYKKIDSTLRGNIGFETDAVLSKTGLSAAFLTPAFPEQGRVVVGGIHLVRGIPLSLTEISRDAVSPVKESYVKSVLEKQSRRRIGNVDLVRVASGGESLRQAVEEIVKQGIQIVIFDAATREDLARVAEAGFEREQIPLFIGSAGLAEEVAGGLASERTSRRFSGHEGPGPARHVFIVSGSASRVSHEQLNRVEERMKLPSFRIDRSFVEGDSRGRLPLEESLARQVSGALVRGRVILKVTEERMLSGDPEGATLPARITESLGLLAGSALEKSGLDAREIVLVLFGGDSALSVLTRLRVKEVEIEGEVLKGIGIGLVKGGKWHGLRLVTKAGGFGGEDTLERIIETF